MSNATPTAILFPGQGSQRDGMRETVEQHAPELLELAIDQIGSDPFARIKDGTAFQQPALYCASVAGWRAGGSPDAEFIAGHSLGELAAAAASGAITAEDGLSLAISRGRAMQDAAEADPGGMLAVLGECDGTAVLASSLGLTVANDNAPDQIVLSGPADAIAEARRKFREAGVRTVRLPVAGAFHSPAMVAAQTGFGEALSRIEIHEPRTTLLSSVTTLPFADLRGGLLSALTRPVRWRETVIALRGHGVTRFLESGPGDVLSGLVARIVDDVEAGPLESAGAHNA
ncbi:MAG: ACP S-malonyltransferase [Actinomycetota bacterium]|nr:ACP S-malonyltransferase [Actinomycetota bacterium]